MNKTTNPSRAILAVAGRTVMFVDHLASSLRIATRRLRRSPLYAGAAVLTLALGTGAAVMVYSVVDAALLRPLPFPDSERVLRIGERNPRGFEASISFENLRDWQERAQSFEAIAPVNNQNADLVGGTEPLVLLAMRTAAEFFDIVAAPPALGRGFAASENVEGGPKAAVISHELWQSHFGGDPEIIGRIIHIVGVPYPVVGVMPDGFVFHRWNDRVDLWLNNPFADLARDRQTRSVGAIARLRPGVTVDQARAELEALHASLAREHPENEGFGAWALPMRVWLSRGLRQPLLMLLGAAALVWVIACLNTANLTLGHASANDREIAVRAALGAGRGRLLQQSLTEAALLSLSGTALGTLLAFWGLASLTALVPQRMGAHEITLDGRVLAVTALSALVTTLAFGALPALRVAGTNPEAVLRSASTSVAGRRWNAAARRALVGSEIAIALVLLTGVGLLVATMLSLTNLALGFEPDNAYAAELRLGRRYVTDAGYGTLPYTRNRQMWDLASERKSIVAQIAQRLERSPEVSAAGVTTGLPFNGSGMAVRIEGRPDTVSRNFEQWDVPPTGDGEGNADLASARFVTPGYLEALRIPLVTGRAIRWSDYDAAHRVALVDEAFVAKYLPQGGAVGRSILIKDGMENPWDEVRIVGVVGTVLESGYRRGALRREPRTAVYLPLGQQNERYTHGEASLYVWANVVVRHDGNEAGVAATLRRVVRAVDPEVPITELASMRAYVADSLGNRRFYGALIGAFAVIAIVLAATGVYAVMAHQVAQRRREIGVRMAVGARARDVTGMVLSQGVKVGLAGVTAGILGSLAATRVLESALYGVKPTEPWVLALTSLSMLGLALLACAVPAWRAASIDPSVTLRDD